MSGNGVSVRRGRAEYHSFPPQPYYPSRSPGSHRAPSLMETFPRSAYPSRTYWDCKLPSGPPHPRLPPSFGPSPPPPIDLIQGAGFSQSELKLLAGFNNISYMFCVLFAVFTLDRFGRRSTMTNTLKQQDHTKGLSEEQSWL
ncbi:hypothetical protein BJ138DRAFT_1116570 [Hygrophoropsis aurantiaca]|uniref:Uncharacterized protein n=1 Tax=Hygrophoropsis aurantiaca TaxID=72124 RepID=A0ACB8A483_9AGAM|nr:hypothetical protein BJ138DRAFT_1116570 [Hygrophoropsis aurantiaca]